MICRAKKPWYWGITITVNTMNVSAFCDFLALFLAITAAQPQLSPDNGPVQNQHGGCA